MIMLCGRSSSVLVAKARPRYTLLLPLSDSYCSQEDSFFVTCHGGQIEVLKAKGATGKVTGAELAKELNIEVGQSFTL